MTAAIIQDLREQKSQLLALHSRLLSILSVEDCYIFGSSLDIWGHSCRIEDIDFTFSLKADSNSDIDVGLENFKGIKDNTNIFGNRITVKKLNNKRIEVYHFPKDNIFVKTKFPYYSKKTGLVYGDFEKALKIYIMRKFRKAPRENPMLFLRKEIRILRTKTFNYNWDPFLKLNISHSYDGINFTRFTK